MRTGHALVIHCINRGSGEALEKHIGEVRAARQEGEQDKAKARVEDLINSLYFYPRYFAKVLTES